jgi:hypothetical protein
VVKATATMTTVRIKLAAARAAKLLPARRGAAERGPAARGARLVRQAAERAVPAAPAESREVGRTPGQLEPHKQGADRVQHPARAATLVKAEEASLLRRVGPQEVMTPEPVGSSLRPGPVAAEHNPAEMAEHNQVEMAEHSQVETPGRSRAATAVAVPIQVAAAVRRAVADQAFVPENSRVSAVQSVARSRSVCVRLRVAVRKNVTIPRGQSANDPKTILDFAERTHSRAVGTANDLFSYKPSASCEFEQLTISLERKRLPSSEQSA